MKKVASTMVSSLLVAAIAACGGGSDGHDGAPGKDGASGSTTPSVSAVQPTVGYASRTIDVTISGNETTWAAAAKADFGANIKVNKLTVASPTSLVANITIDGAAALGPRDVTVTDDAGKPQVWKAAFNVKSPVQITVSPEGGIPQGGIGSVHVQLLDMSGPFDAANVTVDLKGRTDVIAGSANATDFALDFGVQADVLAAAGDIDIVITNGADMKTAIVTPVSKAFKVASRAATKLTGSISGTIQTETDTALYSYAPADANARFVQFNTLGSKDQVTASVLDKTGSYAKAIGGFAGAFGRTTTSTDLVYIVIGDSQSLFGPGPVPASFKLGVLDVPVTPINEAAETTGANNDKAGSSVAIATFPALYKSTLGYGTVTGDKDMDFYKVTITGASAGTPKTIHMATGGDGQTDTLIALYDTDGTTDLKDSADSDYQEDLVSDPITKNGDYFVVVSASTQGYAAAHSTYELFVETK